MRTATAGLPPAAEPPPNERVEALAPGTRLGPYELLAPLASGGMGHVWSAVRIGDFGFRRTVAVKVMREELAGDAGFRRMFLDEARLASRISHTNVVEVLDLGEAGGTLYLAMALVEGDSLAHLVRTQFRQGSLAVPSEVIARIVIDVLRGLHAAHELRGDDGALLDFVHRDVSPQNVLVGVDGVAKLTDFGVAKAAGAAERMSRSHRKGKVAYMAPEQFRGGLVDRRSDVFAVGVVFWELLVGGRMQTSAGKLSTENEVPHPARLNAESNRALGDIAMKALSLAPNERFPTAEEMADAIERAAHHEGLALSSKSVAAWVSPLVSEDVARRRHDTELQLARSRVGSTLDPTQTTTAKAETAPAKRRSWVVALAAIGVVAATLIALAFSRATSASSPSPDVPSSLAPEQSVSALAEAPPSANPIEPAPGPARVPEARNVVLDTAPVASNVASKSVPTKTVRKRSPGAKPAPVPRPQSAPALKPKYDNPYEPSR